MKSGTIVAASLWLAASLASWATAAEIVIQNQSDRPFHFSLRDRSGEAWSRTITIEPHETYRVAVERPKQISYLSDRARFEQLEPGQAYRIADVRSGQLRAVTEVRRPEVPGGPSRGTAPTPASPSTTGNLPADTRPSLETDEDPFDRLFRESSPVPDLPVSPDTEPSAAADAGPDTAADASPEGVPNAAPDVAPNAGVEPVEADKEASAANAEKPARWSPADVRDVQVLAVVDETYRTIIRDWRDRVPSIIGGASDYYEREFGIRLVVERVQPWQYKALDDKPADQWLALLEQPPDGVDLVIGFAGFGDFYRAQPDTSYTGRLGQAAFFGQHVLISDQHDVHENRPKTTLIHELGHVFGAFHIDDPSLLMNPSYAQLPVADIVAGHVAFGEPLRKIVILTRTFDFQRGVDGLGPDVRRQIMKAYRQYGLPSEHSDSDPVTSGYDYLKQRAETRARQMEKKAQQSRSDFLTVSR